MIFPLGHSSLLCAVIKGWLQSNERTYGMINWVEVAANFNVKLGGSDSGNAVVVYTDNDCHNHWKYLAYGESPPFKNNESDQTSYDDHDNSDEVTVRY